MEELESCLPLPLPFISVHERMNGHMFGSCTKFADALYLSPLHSATDRTVRLFSNTKILYHFFPRINLVYLTNSYDKLKQHTTTHLV